MKRTDDEAMKPAEPDVHVVDETEAALLLDLSPSTLSNWRRKGGGPPYIKHRHTIRYRLTDLAKWLDERTRGRDGR